MTKDEIITLIEARHTKEEASELLALLLFSNILFLRKGETATFYVESEVAYESITLGDQHNGVIEANLYNTNPGSLMPEDACSCVAFEDPISRLNIIFFVRGNGNWAVSRYNSVKFYDNFRQVNVFDCEGDTLNSVIVDGNHFHRNPSIK